MIFGVDIFYICQVWLQNLHSKQMNRIYVFHLRSTFNNMVTNMWLHFQLNYNFHYRSLWIITLFLDYLITDHYPIVDHYFIFIECNYQSCIGVTLLVHFLGKLGKFANAHTKPMQCLVQIDMNISVNNTLLESYLLRKNIQCWSMSYYYRMVKCSFTDARP